MSRPEYKIEVMNRDKHCKHPGGCGETEGLTIDHLTPKCIAKALKWTREQTNDLMNTQALCEPHHKEKDSTTVAKMKQVRRQLKGHMIKFGEHK